MSATYQTDFDKEYILTGSRGQLNSIAIPDLQYTRTGQLILFRLMHDRDVKILVTGAGKTTGTGKTTLALHLAKWINAVRNSLFGVSHEWKAEDMAFMDVWGYLQKYKQARPGDCLITDELEYMTDNRRWMTDQNVKFSQAWSILRYKNVITIGTAPGLGDLEKRVKETADLWLRVTKRGEAHPYYTTYDDFDEEVKRFRIRRGGFKERIHFGPLEDDRDYQWLKEQKEELGVPGIDDDKDGSNKKPKDIRKETKYEMVKELLRANVTMDYGLSQVDIADVTGVSQGKVSGLKREMKKEGEWPAEA
jgi:plasmid maintenance system antidote protein VapI